MACQIFLSSHSKRPRRPRGTSTRPAAKWRVAIKLAAQQIAHGNTHASWKNPWLKQGNGFHILFELRQRIRKTFGIRPGPSLSLAPLSNICSSSSALGNRNLVACPLESSSRHTKRQCKIVIGCRHQGEAAKFGLISFFGWFFGWQAEGE